MSMDLNQALVLPISDNGNHRHMQSLVGMRSAALIPPVCVISMLRTTAIAMVFNFEKTSPQNEKKTSMKPL